MPQTTGRRKVVKPIRRAESRSNHGPDPALTLENGAHLKIADQRIFEPKFHEESGAFFGAALMLTQEVVDDRTADGDADGLTFGDKFEFKIDEDVREELFGYKDDKPFRDVKKADLTKAQQEALLDMDNWRIRTKTKLDRIMICLYGKEWTEGRMDFDPEDLVGKEFIAKVSPKTGKKQGSFTEWESYVSVTPPKKKRKPAESGGNRSDTVDLTEEELAEMEEAFPAKEVATS
jgi:hypothetical protein